MASDLKSPNSSGMPLFPLSPERMNVQRFSTTAMSPSSSVVDFGSPRHFKTNSDVQAMVSRFNSLDIKDHAELRKKEAAALRRAQLGREEAESELKRMKEERSRQSRELEESKAREMKVMKRLDAMMEEVHRTKETQGKAQSMYEKEIRRAKKEAFKFSSALVKMQEELKATRNALRVAQTDIDIERAKAALAEQTAFDAQYELVGVQEQLTNTQTRIKTVEEERDALKTSLKEEEVAKIAAEGGIALPPCNDDFSEFASPKKRSQPVVRAPSPTHTPQVQDTLEILKAELAIERARCDEAEQQIQFMRMECQYECCSCRIAESQGLSYISDETFDIEIQRLKTAASGPATPSATLVNFETTVGELSGQRHHENETPEQSVESHGESSTQETVVESWEHQGSSSQGHDRSSPHQLTITVPLKDDRPNSVRLQQTPRRIPSATVKPVTPAEKLVEEVHVYEPSTGQCVGNQAYGSDEPECSTTPQDKDYRTVTTTMTVPLSDAAGGPSFRGFDSPGLSREEAIALLRQRRGRARSVAGTPKKSENEEKTPRREFSAPSERAKSASRNASKGTWR